MPDVIGIIVQLEDSSWRVCLHVGENYPQDMLPAKLEQMKAVWPDKVFDFLRK